MSVENNNSATVKSDKESVLTAPSESATMSRSSPRSAISSFFSHPFILSVVGAVLIAAVGGYLQNRYTIKQQISVCNQEFRKMQIEKLATFMQPLNRYRIVLYNWNHYKTFLKTASPEDKDHMDRSPEEVERRYNELSSKLFDIERGQAVLTSIRAFYHSPEVNRLLDLTQFQVKTMQEDELTEDQIDNLDNEITMSIRSLVVAMQREIRSTVSLPCR